MSIDILLPSRKTTVHFLVSHIMPSSSGRIGPPFLSHMTQMAGIVLDRLHKSLYGCLKSTLFFYKKLVRDLEAYGFSINSYDPFVAKNIIGKKQLIVYWHV